MSEYDPYDNVGRGKLKMKIDGGIKKKKKKDRAKDQKFLDQVNKSIDKEKASKPSEYKITPAEQAFLKQQEKLQKMRILEKASMTHKQRVEEFNRKLDGLTEHFDIPKVSWTK